MTGQWVVVGNPTTEDWQKTLGKHKFWGFAKVEPPCYGSDEFRMVITFKVKDRYNFNRGQTDIASGAPDNENGRFSELGWAHSFLSFGEIHRVVKWKKGDYTTQKIVESQPGR